VSSERSYRGNGSPLRSKSREREPFVIHSTNFNATEYEQKEREPDRKLSNSTLRNQYYRQINLCKKGSLNFYEASTLVGYLLDLIYQSRKLEQLKLKLIRSCDEFNLQDAFSLIEPYAYNPNLGKITQIDMREGLLRHRMKADKVSMDKIYLFFKRYNNMADDMLRYCEFQTAICPVDEREAYLIRQRQVRVMSHGSSIFPKHTIDQFLLVMEQAI